MHDTDSVINDYYTKSEIDTLHTELSDMILNTNTKTETDTLINNTYTNSESDTL